MKVLLGILLTAMAQAAIIVNKTGTFYETDGVEKDGICQCSIATSWSELEEYQKLQSTMEKLEKTVKLQESMDYPVILNLLANYTERMQLLEDNLNSQAVSITITQLFSLRKGITDLQQKVEETTAIDTGNKVTLNINNELEAIRNYTETAWEMNPYKQRNYYKEQLNIIRERLYNDGINDQGTFFEGDNLPAQLPPSTGWCDNGAVSFTRPYTHKEVSTEDDSGASSVGSWFKDPKPQTEADKTRICLIMYERKYIGMDYDYYTETNIRTYKTDFHTKCFKDYAAYTAGNSTNATTVTQISGVLYKGALFYINSDYVNKVNYSTGINTTIRVSTTAGSTFAGRESDSSISIQVDEEGMWLLYSISSDSRLAVSKLDPDNLVVKQTWFTPLKMNTVCTAFMMCGRMYTVKSCATHGGVVAQKNFVFDTHTAQGYNATYGLPSIYGELSGLVYNSREREIFGWDKRHMVTYKVIWSG